MSTKINVLLFYVWGSVRARLMPFFHFLLNSPSIFTVKFVLSNFPGDWTLVVF